MKVLACGSRNWHDDRAIYDRLAVIANNAQEEPVLIHGGAKGADSVAGEYALGLGFLVRVFPAEWDRYGKTAGRVRNIKMLEEKPDLVLAFQIDGSPGTQHTIDEARKRGIPVEVIKSGEREESP